MSHLKTVSIATLVFAMSATSAAVMANEQDRVNNSVNNNGSVYGQSQTDSTVTPTVDNDRHDRNNSAHKNNEVKSTEHGETQKLLSDAKRVVDKLKADKDVSSVVSQAKGLYVIPYYGRGAFIAGGQGGEGVLLNAQGDHNKNPVFYNFGSVSVGAQAGGEMGEIVMLLMTDKAVNSFKQDNNFSLNAEAGLTLINWSAQAQGNIGAGDIVIWSNTEGAFAGGALSVSNIFVDDEANKAYYGKDVRVTDILDGKVSKSSDARPGTDPAQYNR